MNRLIGKTESGCAIADGKFAAINAIQSIRIIKFHYKF